MVGRGHAGAWQRATTKETAYVTAPARRELADGTRREVTLHARVAEQETLAMMGGGDVFGEMALLLDEPRAATVEALDRVTVLVLDKHTMNEGLGIGGWTGAEYGSRRFANPLIRQVLAVVLAIAGGKMVLV